MPVRIEQSETNTQANRVHSLEGCRGFGEVMAVIKTILAESFMGRPEGISTA